MLFRSYRLMGDLWLDAGDETKAVLAYTSIVDVRPGDADAQESEDYANAIGVENILELRLLAVERALRRIDKGSYGHCSNCEADQPKERLEADPAAERCIKCRAAI